jgi:hypothetical protein
MSAKSSGDSALAQRLKAHADWVHATLKTQRATLEVERDKKNQCRVCAWLETKEDEDRLAVEDAIRDHVLTQRQMWRICRDNGLEAGETTFRNHIHECVLDDWDLPLHQRRYNGGLLNVQEYPGSAWPLLDH